MAPDNLNDLIQIDIDLAHWGEQLDLMVSKYAEKLADMPKISLGEDSLARGIEQINASINNLVTGMHEGLGLLSDTMHETATAVENVSAKVQEAGKKSSGFGNLFNGSILESIANTARFYAQWQLVVLLFEGLQFILTEPFKILGQGFDRISTVADRTADLQGAIAATVTYSKDFAENFRIAGEQANGVVKALEDIAIKAGLDDAQLTKAFKAFLESGGGSMVSTLKEAVGVTELFGLAIHASGKDAESTRALISEIPKLMDGSVAPASKLLEVFHLTKTEWESIRASALQHHDLLSQLEPIMRPYLSVVDEANLRWSVITEQLTLLKERTEALIAGPLYENFLKILQDIRNYFEKHAEQIEEIARNAGTLLGSLSQITGELIKQSNVIPLLVSGFAAAAGLAAQIANVLNFAKAREDLVNATNHQKDDLINAFAANSDAADNISNTEARNRKKLELHKSYNDALAALDKEYDRQASDLYHHTTQLNDELGNQVKKTVDSLNNLSKPETFSQFQKRFVDELANDPLNKPIGSARGPIDKTKQQDDTLQAVRKFYQDEIDSVREGEDRVRNEISRAEAAKTISILDGETQRKQSYARERDNLVGIAEFIKENVSNLGLKPAQADSLLKSLDHAQSEARRKAEDEARGSDVKISEEHNRIAEIDLRADVQRAQQLAQFKLQLAKQAEQQGLISHEQAARAEIDATEQSELNQLKVLTDQRDKLAVGTADRKKVEQEIATLRLTTEERLQVLFGSLITAKRRDRDEEMAHYTRTINQLELQRIQAQRSQIRLEGGGGPISNQSIDIAEAQAKLNDVAQKASEAWDKYQQSLIDSNGVETNASQKLHDQFEALVEQAAALGEQLETLRSSFNAKKGLASIFGGDAVQTLSDPNAGGFAKFGAAIEGAGNALKLFSNVVSAIQQGISQGGVLGGIGAGLGQAGGIVGAFNPVAGAIISGVGEMFSFIGGLFSAKAKEIAKEIESDLKTINQSFQTGQTTLNGTIQALQQERQNAINRLSGQKGGQDQLNKILPQIDQELAQLQKQATDIRVAFDQAVKGLQLGGGTLTDWEKTWEGINKQVKDYLGAGGSLAEANNFLKLSLQQQEQQLRNSLESGEKTAIEDALKLNDLIKQRQQLINDEAKSEFQLLTKDSLERRQSLAVQTGQQLSEQRKQAQDKLHDLQDQIDLQSKQLGMEKTVFNIATDIAALKQRSNAIELDQLNQQLDKYRQMQQILQTVGAFTFGSGQSFNPNFVPGIDPNPKPPQPTIIVNLPPGWRGNGRQLGGDLADELYRRGRQFLQN